MAGVKRVGVFDSGVGGITVLSELWRRFPATDFVYLGDTAHVPYGPKSPSQIQKLSADCATTLKQRNIDLLVVACNTASSWALPAIEKVMGPIPVVGVVEPGVDAVLNAIGIQESGSLSLNRGFNLDRAFPLLVLATRATVQSHSYGLKLQERLYANRVFHQLSIIEQSCPLLVPMIEEGWIDHPILHQTLREYVEPYRKKYLTGVALLGCTHYPWIHEAFERALPGWIVVNSAWAVGEALAETLGQTAEPAQARYADFGSQDSLPWRSDVESGGKFDDNSDEKKDQYPKQLRKLEDRVGKLVGRIEWIFTDPEALPDFAKKLILANPH